MQLMQLSFYFSDPPPRDRRGRCGASRLLLTKNFAPGSGDTRGDSLLPKLSAFKQHMGSSVISLCKMASSCTFPFVPRTTCRGFERRKRELSSPVRKRILPRWAGGIVRFHKRKTCMTPHRPRLSWGGGIGAIK